MAFSDRVSSPEWRAAAEDWVRSQVVDAGGRVVGDITQPRIRPWSTQLVVPTDVGRLWFKANCPSLAFEPAVHRTLARLDPGEVDEPFAVDTDRGWILTRDRGTTLGDSHHATLEDWRAVVTLAARLQRRLAAHGPDLLSAGLPDCSPHTVPARYAELTDALAALPRGHPSHLDESRARQLRSGSGLVEDAVGTLLDSPLPTASLQHGDLHPGNVFAVEARLRVFDFGDAQWAHPLETLAVPWGWVHARTTLPWPAIVDAYASGWADVIDPVGFDRLLSAAMVTQPVNRCSTWWGAVADATPAELVEWGDRPRFFLELVLEPFP
jgi:hypothetical protein